MASSSASSSASTSSIAARFVGTEATRSLVSAGGDEPFLLGELPYDYAGLEPVIDQETMHWHHDVHHRNYVKKLNAALKESAPESDVELEDILHRVSNYPKAVRVNGGGHWNHTFFWQIMTDRKEDQEITPDVLRMIEASFTSLEEFKTAFVKAGMDHVGSGWVWLIRVDHSATGTSDGGSSLDGQSQLKIVTTANQDNPIMDVVEARGTPILTCDLWEHAYYLKHKANREEFLKKFFGLVNWAQVQKLAIGPISNLATDDAGRIH